jgi:hypothetical protein
MMAYMSSNDEMPSTLQGVVSLVTAGGIAYDETMENIISVKLTAVGRAKISRARAVKGGLLVADGWQPWFDDVPEASYKHQLEVSLQSGSLSLVFILSHRFCRHCVSFPTTQWRSIRCDELSCLAS